jgi:hypothetical protein
MDTTWWKWIFVVGVALICLVRVMIRQRRIAASRSVLDEKELAVVRRAVAGVGRDELIGQTLGYGVLNALDLQLLINLLLNRQASRYRKDRAAAKKLIDFDPRELNRAQGVIFSFHELRITRTELIRGYEENAQRIPLRGLTATVVTGQTVQIRIEGPDTNFVYRNAFDAQFNVRPALQFAALLNYEASLQGAPPKKVQEKPPSTSGARQTEAREKSTKVRCQHCQHVQTVPLSQPTFVCEQCKAHLKLRAAPANSS